MISIIAAVSENGVIGKNNKLPWNIPSDLEFFKNKTNGHPVLMGRKTFESIGSPLPNRKNIIITRNKNYNSKYDDIIIKNNIESAIKEGLKYDKDIFIIGGSEIYKQSFPYIDDMWITQIHDKFEGDSYFPIDFKNFKIISKEKNHKNHKDKHDFTFIHYELHIS